MTISFIVAASENNAIGSGNELPWHLPADFKYFKATTLGKPILMGRKTYESLGKPLPGRTNIVVSAQKDIVLPAGVIHCLTLRDGIEMLKQQSGNEGFIIGGGQIFAAAMNIADRIYMTRVHIIVEHADTYFPAIDHTHWRLVWEEPHPADEKHNYAFTFQKFEQVTL